MKAPINMFTGKEYSGINARNLSSREFKDNRYATYKAWLEHDYQVQKGSKGTTICVVYEEDNGRKKAFYTRLFNFEQVAPIAPIVEE